MSAPFGDTSRDARSVAAATRVVGLRTPLARIRLLASRLEREATATREPEAASAAEILCEAVAELDLGISATLAVLFPPRHTTRCGDADEALESLRTRVAPSLAVRGIAWLPAGRSGRSLSAPASWLREAAVSLLRDVAAASGRDTRVRLVPVADPTGHGAVGIGVYVDPSNAPSDTGWDEAFFPTAGPLALRLGGRLEIGTSQGGGQRAATLWLPRVRGEAAACAVS